MVAESGVLQVERRAALPAYGRMCLEVVVDVHLSQRCVVWVITEALRKFCRYEGATSREVPFSKGILCTNFNLLYFCYRTKKNSMQYCRECSRN